MEETLIIRIEEGDGSGGLAHQSTHPHVVHIYSEVDETDHRYRVRPHTLLQDVFDRFYADTAIQKGELDRFKCETNGEDLAEFAHETFAKFLEQGRCNELVWIFSNRPIHIVVNTIPKTTEKRVLSFMDVVNIAYDNNPPQGDNWEFTVSYRKGPRENPKGSLTAGHSVRVKDGMIFNVTATDKS